MLSSTQTANIFIDRKNSICNDNLNIHINKPKLSKPDAKITTGEHSSPLHYFYYPINNAVDKCGGGAVDDDGTCDFEHICGGAEDVALCCCQYRTHRFGKKYLQ